MEEQALAARQSNKAIVCNYCNNAKWLIVRNGRGIEYMCQGCGIFAYCGLLSLHPFGPRVFLRQFIPKWNAEIIATHLFCFKCQREDRHLSYIDWFTDVDRLIWAGLEPIYLGFTIIQIHGLLKADEGLFFEQAIVICQDCLGDEAQIKIWAEREYFLQVVSLSDKESCQKINGDCCPKELDFSESDPA